jgi:hypothetical protein
MAIFAPSWAHLSAIARPIPLDAPVITIVFPFNDGGWYYLFLIWDTISSNLFIVLREIIINLTDY